MIFAKKYVIGCMDLLFPKALKLQNDFRVSLRGRLALYFQRLQTFSTPEIVAVSRSVDDFGRKILIDFRGSISKYKSVFKSQLNWLEGGVLAS